MSPFVIPLVRYASGTTTVVNHRKFDAFGNLTTQSDATVKFLYSYTGREWDGDAGLYYYRARWYDAGIGRFISEDPIGFAAGDENLSRYVGNSSPNAEDPSGLMQDEPTIYTPMDPEEIFRTYALPDFLQDPLNPPTTNKILQYVGKAYLKSIDKYADEAKKAALELAKDNLVESGVVITAGVGVFTLLAYQGFIEELKVPKLKVYNVQLNEYLSIQGTMQESFVFNDPRDFFDNGWRTSPTLTFQVASPRVNWKFGVNPVINTQFGGPTALDLSKLFRLEFDF